MTTKKLTEKDIEMALCKRVKKLGGLCEKFSSPGRRSVPDRIVTLPVDYDDYCDYTIIFVELKAPGKKPTKAQLKDHERRRALGCEVRVIDSLEQVEEFEWL